MSEQNTPNRFEQARLEKLEKIQSLGLDPWGQRFDNHLPIAEIRDKAPEESGVEGEPVRVAGRMMLRSNKGKLRFFHIQDWSGRVQVMAMKNDLSEEQWELITALDLGDIIGVDGTMRPDQHG
ncbi:MAG: OB-fold nucleic acid binding domain-containing protein [Planctomycetaceae bacterium]